MRLRWLWFDYADPALPLTLKQRWRAIARPPDSFEIPMDMRLRRMLWYVGFITPMLLWRVLGWRPASPGLFAWLLHELPFMLALWIWATLLAGVLCRREHFLRIRMEGVNICTSCGYWLRGLQGDIVKCPECGSEQQNMPEPPE